MPSSDYTLTEMEEFFFILVDVVAVLHHALEDMWHDLLARADMHPRRLDVLAVVSY